MKKILLTSGLLVGLLVAIIGCGDRISTQPDTNETSRPNVEQLSSAAKSALDTKYNDSFTILGLSLKGSDGPFKDEMYTGAACNDSQPYYSFDIWVSRDGETIVDSYPNVEMIPVINKWATNLITDLWPESKACVKQSILKPSEKYIYSDIDTYYANVSVSNNFAILIPKDADLSNMKDKVMELFDRMGKDVYGRIDFYLVDDMPKDMESMYRVMNNGIVTWSVSIRMSESSCEMIFS